MKDDSWFFGRLFDFNGDWKTTVDEEFLAYMMWEEAQKEAEAKKQKPASLDPDPGFFSCDTEIPSPHVPKIVSDKKAPEQAAPKPETVREEPWWENLSFEMQELADEYFLSPEDYDDPDSFFDDLEFESGQDLFDERFLF